MTNPNVSSENPFDMFKNLDIKTYNVAELNASKILDAQKKLTVKYGPEQAQRIDNSAKLFNGALVRLLMSKSITPEELKQIDAVFSNPTDHNPAKATTLQQLGANTDNDPSLSSPATPLTAEQFQPSNLDYYFKFPQEATPILTHMYANLLGFMGENNFPLSPDDLATAMNNFDNLATLDPSLATDRLKAFVPELRSN